MDHSELGMVLENVVVGLSSNIKGKYTSDFGCVDTKVYLVAVNIFNA